MRFEPNIGGADRGWLTAEDLEEAAAAAAYLFPDEVAAAEECTADDAVLSERISFSESLHWLADATASPTLHALADAIAPPALHALVAWVAAYIAYRPFAAFMVRPTDAAAGDLRTATKTILDAKPRSYFELAMKIRFAALVGIHARLQRQYPSGGAEAVTAYNRFCERLDRLPNSILVGAFVPRFRPVWANEQGLPPNQDETLILDAVGDAGLKWTQALAGDIARVAA